MGGEATTEDIKKLDAFGVDGPESFEGQRDEGVSRGERLVLQLLAVGGVLCDASSDGGRGWQVGLGHSVGDCNVPRHAFSGEPWDLRETVWTLAV